MPKIFFSFIRILITTTPFITMIVMVLALWGVGGKTTYIGLETPKKPADTGLMAENYLVSGTKAKSKEICSTDLKNKENTLEPEKSDSTKNEKLNEKIDWEHTV
jgi:hypothetical protein